MKHFLFALGLFGISAVVSARMSYFKPVLTLFI